MKELHGVMERQIRSNRNANLFCSGEAIPLAFTPETIESLKDKEFARSFDESLMEYVVQRVLEEFCYTNQFYSFDAAAKGTLKVIYRALAADISARSPNFAKISREHYARLAKWLQATNKFSKDLYSSKATHVTPAVCSEYSADFQLRTLGISLCEINGPVLDIGCGRQGNLVRYFKSQGFDAYGIDRFQSGEETLIKADWLEYDYGEKKWGLIISNMGFSNHFRNHDLREDGNHVAYARTYMSILRSLKPGGKFIYAPTLPFIERYLDAKSYSIAYQPSQNQDLQVATIKRASK